MIDLTAKDVEEFRRLYRQETGREIDAKTAGTYALALIRLVELAIGGDPPGYAPRP